MVTPFRQDRAVFVHKVCFYQLIKRNCVVTAQLTAVSQEQVPCTRSANQNRESQLIREKGLSLIHSTILLSYLDNHVSILCITAETKAIYILPAVFAKIEVYADGLEPGPRDTIQGVLLVSSRRFSSFFKT